MGKRRTLGLLIGGLTLVSAPILLFAFLVLGIVPVVRVPGALPVFKVPAVKPHMPKVPIVVPDPGMKQVGTLIVATGNVREAIEVVREEHSRTREERDALATFLDTVSQTEVSQEMATAGARQMIVGTDSPGIKRSDRIRNAYEDTVMGVSHYDEEYDDTVTDSMAEEFGPSISAALASGQPFTLVLKQQLMQAAQEAQEEREWFLEILDTEQTELQKARTHLETAEDELESTTVGLPSEQSYGELIQGYERLREVEADCELLLDHRQKQRIDGHNSVDTLRNTITDIQSYLYSALPVTYPVLADTTALLEKVRRTRRQFSRELAARY